MWFLVLFSYIISFYSPINCLGIENIALDYFTNPTVKTCEEHWNPHRIAFERTLTKGLREGFGAKSMNVLIKRHKDALLLTKGYYHNDNNIKIILQDVMLNHFPYLYNADISYPICNNVLKIESSLSKMILHASYILFRNTNDIVYEKKDQDPYLVSPFRFEQVRNTGQVAISIDRCLITGIAITSFNGRSVNVEYHSLNISACQINFEIFHAGWGIPPVIANYVLDGDGGIKIENLLMNSLDKELLPQLQAALYAHVNTTAIFRADLPDIMHTQNSILEQTQTYINNVVGQMNSLIKPNQAVKMPDFHISWNDTFDKTHKIEGFTIRDVELSGLDSAYSAHIGAPYKLSSTKVVEQVRMSLLQIVGKIELTTPSVEVHSFAVEINDAAIDVEIHVNGPTEANETLSFEVVGWRTMDFSCPEVERLPIEPLVAGYLNAQLPKALEVHFEDYFKTGLTEHESDYNNQTLGQSPSKPNMRKKEPQKKMAGKALDLSIQDENYDDYYYYFNPQVYSDPLKKKKMLVKKFKKTPSPGLKKYRKRGRRRSSKRGLRRRYRRSQADLEKRMEEYKQHFEKIMDKVEEDERLGIKREKPLKYHVTDLPYNVVKK